MDFEERFLLAGRKMAFLENEDEEIVITGMAGKFPKSKNLEDLKKNLENKVDMISHYSQRWKSVHLEIPERVGMVEDIDRFDCGFFGLSQEEGKRMDRQLGQILERVYEAIIDSGYHPSEIAGSRTGFYLGVCNTENELYEYYKNPDSHGISIPSCQRSLIANHVSYFLKIKGPSVCLDTACSSSMFAMDMAYRNLREGKCNMAIVCGSQLMLHPYLTLQFTRLGVLSKDGCCKSFDNEGNGYVRSEGIGAILLQKSKDARRIYAKVIHAKTNCDGFIDLGLTYPCGESQKMLMREIYQESGILPNDLGFLECHCTGTFVGDPEELKSIDEVICKKRDRPILVGAIKSNLGHNEGCSGLVSIIKVLLCSNFNTLYPNLHYISPRAGVEPLIKKRMNVVTENTPWPQKDIIGINSFGFGGANGHLIIKRYNKLKINNGLPRDDIPRLLCVSGRTAESVTAVFDDIATKNLDAEFIGLLHKIFRLKTLCHNYRGFAIYTKTEERKRLIETVSEIHKNLVFVFGSTDTKWASVGRSLFTLPIFAGIIQKIHNIFKANKLEVDISSIVNNYKPYDLSHYVIGTTCIQISLVDLLKKLDLTADSYKGYSLGAIPASYANNDISFEEAVMSSYYIYKTFDESLEKEKNKKMKVDDDLQDSEKTMLRYFKECIISKDNANKNLHEKLVNKILKNSNNNLNLNPNEIYLEIGTNTTQSISNGISKHEEALKISLVEFGYKDVIDSLLESLGTLYLNGFELNLEELYPKVQFPVSRGTSMISPLIKWNHDFKWNFEVFDETKSLLYSFEVFKCSVKTLDWAFLTGHVIDGRNLFPATGYLKLIIDLFAKTRQLVLEEMKVVLENIKFIRAVNIPKDGRLELILSINESGHFEVSESGIVVVQGKIFELEDENLFLGYNMPLSKGINNKIPLKKADVYKELRLRGYNYNGVFKAINSFKSDMSTGYIDWNDNIIAFMDNMLQLKVLKMDTRNLYVPTSIQRLVLDGIHKKEYVNSLSNNLIPVYINDMANCVRCEFVEILGLEATPIQRKKPGDPVLETYKFIPNKVTLDLRESLRINVQIALENLPILKMKIVEVPSTKKEEYFAPILVEVLNDLPLMQPEITILSNDVIEIEEVNVEVKSLKEESKCFMVILDEASNNPKQVSEALEVLIKQGYILSREKLNKDIVFDDSLEVLTVHNTPDEKLVLLTKKNNFNNSTALKINNNVSEKSNWLTALQETIKTSDVTLIAENEPESGILGFVNCLRKELLSVKIQSVFICDEAPEFDQNIDFYKKQLRKGFAINVFKNGSWGTYRHLLLSKLKDVESEHCTVVSQSGDFSSLRWVEGPLSIRREIPADHSIIQTNFCSLNFRDIMLTSGRINADSVRINRMEQFHINGLEFAGRKLNGQRVFGLKSYGCLATIVEADNYLFWETPKNWSILDSATVPCVYGTVLWALIHVGKVKKGESILIHSGTGGIGQSAINVAHHFGLEIFTTVGSELKRDFIKRHFPFIKHSHIGNSKDTTFEQIIKKETRGRGVDIILNSLAEEKLKVSLRCLAKGGKFLELGKFDSIQDLQISMGSFKGGGCFHGIHMDAVMESGVLIKKKFHKLLKEALEEGYIKPLIRTVFDKDQLEEAFRFMASGKHIGKIVLKIQEEEKYYVPTTRKFKCEPRYLCDPNKSVVIVGGLGGFGLELADWLVLRNCKKLILSSRKGIVNGYQAERISLWNSYGVKVVVVKENVATEDGCEKLLKTANKLGPVQSIFNLGVVLQDANFEKQSQNSFVTSFEPKAIATMYLDKVSRELCPDLRDFVVFSSVSCGRGNAGQTNYGMANSIMERICEKRKSQGYPGLAIQWGAVGDVGLVAEMQESNVEVVIGGTLQQKITSCLNTLNLFLKQDEPVVASMVVAEKNILGNFSSAKEAIASILSIRDLKTISLNATLPEIGMDSMMAVEVKQILEREFEVVLTPQEIRSLTFAKIDEIDMQRIKQSDETGIKESKTSDPFHYLIENIGKSFSSNYGLRAVEMKTISTNRNNPVVLLPGIEGFCNAFEPLVKNLKNNAVCLQYPCNKENQSPLELAKEIFNVAREQIGSNDEFKLVGHSFGGPVVLELAVLLEQNGLKGKVVVIDGVPDVICEVVSHHFKDCSQDEFENMVFLSVISALAQDMNNADFLSKITNCSSFEEKMKIFVEKAPNSISIPRNYLEKHFLSVFKRLDVLRKYKKTSYKIKSQVKLLKPSLPLKRDCSDDYKLKEHCENFSGFSTIEGNHITILENPETAKKINEFFL